jgi:hypothetical protein
MVCDNIFLIQSRNWYGMSRVWLVKYWCFIRPSKHYFFGAWLGGCVLVRSLAWLCIDGPFYYLLSLYILDVTKDIMSRKHWQVDGGLNCVLCNPNVRETRDHLFFDCPFVINCWNQLNIVWNNNLLISARILQSKQVFRGPCFIEIFACATWNFRKIRNDYIFRGQIPSFRRWKVRFLSDLDLHKFRVKPSVVQPLSDWSRSCFL